MYRTLSVSLTHVLIFFSPFRFHEPLLVLNNRLFGHAKLNLKTSLDGQTLLGRRALSFDNKVSGEKNGHYLSNDLLFSQEPVLKTASSEWRGYMLDPDYASRRCSL